MRAVTPVKVNGQQTAINIGSGEFLTIIAGPCVIENRDLTMRIAEQLVSICARLGLPLIFKASFDKANRTSSGAYRGLGIQEGLAVLESVHAELGVPTVTDIHEAQQAATVAEVCQVLQIPAFLARQTDLLVAAAQTGAVINVKKGQFMAPTDMQYVLGKLNGARPQNVGARVLLCERGTFFGYGRLVNDMQALPIMRSFDAPVIFDATHSVQQPGGLGGATGGNREMVWPLARAAVAAGVDGVFLETHPDPDTSPSDGPNMVPLQNVERLLRQLQAIFELSTTW
ncbi:MAG: 3-deoxy-8-phosphooctulonate synthase [Planctomycetales bacterium]|nr:3-deoxy-8-phosphooctulonate synthase [Planctomycetales bacterium]